MSKTYQWNNAQKTSILIMLPNGETSVIIDNLDAYENVQPYTKG